MTGSVAFDGFEAPPGSLDTASLGVPPPAAVAALEEAVRAWASNEIRAPDYDVHVARARSAFARIVGVDPAWVAIGAQVSVFTGLVAASLPAGAEVVGYEGDFTSLLFPFLARGDLRLRLVALEDVAAAVTRRTALVAVSAVQSADGRLADLEAISAAARDAGAWTYVDATQGAGWLPFDASRFDVVTAGAYKWLLAPRGAAFMTVRPERLADIVPLAAGWYAGADPWTSIYGPPLRLAADARRFDTSPAWLAWVGAAPALEALADAGATAVHAHDLALANRFRAGMGEPAGDSAIVTVAAPGAQERLARAGVRASVRAGRARLSFHLYTTVADVDRALNALA